MLPRDISRASISVRLRQLHATRIEVVLYVPSACCVEFGDDLPTQSRAPQVVSSRHCFADFKALVSGHSIAIGLYLFGRTTIGVIARRYFQLTLVAYPS